MGFYLAAAVAALLLAGIVYIAVSKKTAVKMRIAAIVALALMFLTVLVSVLIVFAVGTTAVTEPGILPNALPPETLHATPEDGNNVLLVFLIFMLVMFFLVLAFALRERRRHGKKSTPGSAG